MRITSYDFYFGLRHHCYYIIGGAFCHDTRHVLLNSPQHSWGVKQFNYKIYCDDGKSGKDIEHRPSFQLMMTDARNGLISKIVVKKYDRFSRNMREYLKEPLI